MKYRTIGGKAYAMQGYTFTKKRADEQAGKYRRQGRHVRVIKGKRSGRNARGEFTGKTVYTIFTRSK